MRGVRFLEALLKNLFLPFFLFSLIFFGCTSRQAKNIEEFDIDIRTVYTEDMPNTIKETTVRTIDGTRIEKTEYVSQEQLINSDQILSVSSISEHGKDYTSIQFTEPAAKKLRNILNKPSEVASTNRMEIESIRVWGDRFWEPYYLSETDLIGNTALIPVPWEEMIKDMQDVTESMEELIRSIDSESSKNETQ